MRERRSQSITIGNLLHKTQVWSFKETPAKIIVIFQPEVCTRKIRISLPFDLPVIEGSTRLPSHYSRRRIQIQTLDPQLKCVISRIASRNIQIQSSSFTVLKIHIHNQQFILLFPEWAGQNITHRPNDT